MFIREISESLSEKKWFFITLFLVLIVLILLRLFALSDIDNGVLQNIINLSKTAVDNLIALTCSVLIASGVYLFLMSSKVSKQDIKIIRPTDIKHELDRIIGNTASYCYAGHTARWTRSSTLEKLKDKAKSKNTRTEISIIILDPRDEVACKYYSEFGHANRKNSRADNMKDVQIELISTILICAKYNSDPFLDIDLGFFNKISLFRLDISDTAVILTKPSKKESALLFPKDTFFYNSYKDEFKVIRDQSKHIILEKLELNKDRGYYRLYLQKIGLSLENFNLTDDDFDKVIKELDEPTKPY